MIAPIPACGGEVHDTNAGAARKGQRRRYLQSEQVAQLACFPTPVPPIALVAFGCRNLHESSYLHQPLLFQWQHTRSRFLAAVVPGLMCSALCAGTVVADCRGGCCDCGVRVGKKPSGLPPPGGLKTTRMCNVTCPVLASIS